MEAVRLTKRFIVTGTDRKGLDEHTDAVMDELIALESDDLRDSDVSVDLAASRVEISIAAAVTGTFDEAAAAADAAIRTAIHAAGGHTPEWAQVVFSAEKSEADLVPA